jgi:hypothetical protein
VPDSKVLKDLVGEDTSKVEFSIMVIGGAAALKSAVEEKEPKVVGEGDMDGVIGEGRSVLATEEFWGDLKGFLVQRLKDEKEGERVWGVFKDAMKGGK